MRLGFWAIVLLGGMAVTFLVMYWLTCHSRKRCMGKGLHCAFRLGGWSLPRCVSTRTRLNARC